MERRGRPHHDTQEYGSGSSVDASFTQAICVFIPINVSSPPGLSTPKAKENAQNVDWEVTMWGWWLPGSG